MSMKNITDKQVCEAVIEARRLDMSKWPYELLAEWTGEPEKVCYRAMERAFNRDYLNYGVSLRTAWVTTKARDTLGLN